MIPPVRRADAVPPFRRYTQGFERNLLCAVDRLPMEGNAEGSATEEHGAFLFLVMGLGRHVGSYSRRTLCGHTRSGRTRGESHGCNHRLSKQQGRSKRGSSLDPQSFDSGKKITGRKRHILVDTLGLLLCVSAWNKGSDSISMTFADDLVISFERNHLHACRSSDFRPHSHRPDRR